MGLAVSGGPDSLALLALAHVALPRKFAVATVDHGLRAGSAAEAAMVAGLCEGRGIAHRTLTVEVPRGGNLSAAARTVRYEALGNWARELGLTAIATAHHADDQAETLLLRLNRGAGLAGLAAMRPKTPLPGPGPGSPAIALLRPLLGWRKAELVAVVAAAGWTPADDPSNRDPRFDRARLRAALATGDLLDPARVAASAGHLRDAAEALDWAVAREFAERVTTDPEATTYCPLAPRAIRLGVLARIVGAAQPPRGDELARLLVTLESGGIATLGGWRGDAREAGLWRFTRTAPPRSKS